MTRSTLAALALALALTGCPDHSTPPTRSEGPAASSAPVQTTPSGLRYQDLVAGTGDPAKPGNVMVVHYHGWLTDGTTFDASRPRGEPFEFTLGKGEVIKGWDEGVSSMRVGGVRRLTVPPELGYGSRPAGKIPPSSTLIFDVELLGQKAAR